MTKLSGGRTGDDRVKSSGARNGGARSRLTQDARLLPKMPKGLMGFNRRA